jgi:transposase
LCYDFVKEHREAFKLGHPAKMKVISHCETKNDNHDAAAIAEMSIHGYLPPAHVSSVAMRDIRAVVRYRGALVQQGRSIENPVHSRIDPNIWIDEQPKRFKDLFCQRGLKWIETVWFKPTQRFTTESIDCRL